MTARQIPGVLTTCLLVVLLGCQANDPLRAQAASQFVPWSQVSMTAALPGKTDLTLYQGGWGLVTDSRPMSLKMGLQGIRFPSVPIQTQAEGAYLQLPAEVLRRRFRYDASSINQLLAQYDGKSVEIVSRTGTASAIVLMTATGPMYRIGDRLYVTPPGKLALPITKGLASVPSLDWMVKASASWQGIATASYICNQLDWHSSYTLITDPRQSQGRLQHWADLSNQSGGNFRQVRVTLIAGNVRRLRAPMPVMGGFRAYAAPMAEAEPYAGRYAYHLPGRIDLPWGIKENLQLEEFNGITIDRHFQVGGSAGIYPLNTQELPQHARLRLEIENTTTDHLGKPLPAGTVTVYTPDKEGILAIAGEATIPDTPVKQKLILDLGEAFDVTSQRRQTIYQVKPDGHEVGYAITLKNEQAQPVTVEVLETIPGDWTMVSASQPYDRLTANQIRFRVPVPAKGEVVVSYEASIKKEPR